MARISRSTAQSMPRSSMGEWKWLCAGRRKLDARAAVSQPRAINSPANSGDTLSSAARAAAPELRGATIHRLVVGIEAAHPAFFFARFAHVHSLGDFVAQLHKLVVPIRMHFINVHSRVEIEGQFQ